MDCRDAKQYCGRGTRRVARRYACEISLHLATGRGIRTGARARPAVKHLRGALWEMRLKGKDGISGALYVTAVGRRVVVVRVFIKKTQNTPNREIELALRRAKEILQ